jgi:hypothetical protein
VHSRRLCSISKVPTGMPALEAARVSRNVGDLSAQVVASQLEAARAPFCSLTTPRSTWPEGLNALETVSMEGCLALAADWLQQAAAKRITTVYAAGAAYSACRHGRCRCSVEAATVLQQTGCQQAVQRACAISTDDCYAASAETFGLAASVRVRGRADACPGACCSSSVCS